MISIEKVSRVLNHFNVSFSEQAVLGYLQRGILEKAPRIPSGYQARNTKYSYSVGRDSLVKFLLNQGFTEKEVTDILPAEN